MLLYSSSLFAAYDFKVGDIYYNILTHNTVEVTSPKVGAYSGEVVIPQTVTYNSTTYSITSIGIETFFNCTDLTSITIGNNIETINSHAFNGCIGLTSITIPANVRSIHTTGTFYGCTNLKTIIWNAKECVDFDNGSPFSYCPVNSITFGNEVKTIPAYLCANLTNLTSVIIPDNVVSIHDYAFWTCSELTSVTIGNGVTDIGVNAFSLCEKINNIKFGNNIKTIGQTAFLQCAISEITLPSSVRHIGGMAFGNCANLRTVTMSGVNPPVQENGAGFPLPVYGSNNNIIFNVPCNALEAYQKSTSWASYKDYIQADFTYLYSVQSSNENYGSIKIIQEPTCANNIFIFEAIPNVGYDFLSWNDGNTENPREVAVNENVNYSASFTKIDDSAYYFENKVITTQSHTFKEGAQGKFEDGKLYFYMIDETAAMELLFYINAVDEKNYIPVGEYPINKSTNLNTVYASPGGYDEGEYPSYYIPLADSYGTYYEAFYLTSGKVIVTADEKGIKVVVDAKSYYGSTINVTYTQTRTGSTSAIDNIKKSDICDIRKVFKNGTIYIFRNGEKYTIDGRKVE